MASRNLSFASIAVLINGVIFGMFSYWASIFLLPKEVVDQITNICRNYLWGAQTIIPKFHMLPGNKSAEQKPKVDWGSRTLMHGIKLLLQN